VLALAGFAFLFRLLVLEFAVVQQAADRRHGRWGNFHKVKVGFAGKLKGLGCEHDAELLAGPVDKQDFPGSDAVVDSEFSGYSRQPLAGGKSLSTFRLALNIASDRQPVNERWCARWLATVVHAAAAPAGTPDALEAVTAVHRAVAARLERHFGRLPTAAANHVEHLALGSRRAHETACTTTAAAFAFATCAALGTAGAAALGVAEATRGVELLVVGAEGKLLAAVRAY
jgi:hypothetical protein